MKKVFSIIFVLFFIFTPFRIHTASAADVQGFINLTSPSGGEVYTEGQNIRIKWTASSNINTISISLLFSGISEWIAFSAPNTGYYDWTAQAMQGRWSDGTNDKYQIEITGGEIGLGSLPDVISSEFTIHNSLTTPSQNCSSCMQFDKLTYGVGDALKLSISNVDANTDIYWYSVHDGKVTFGRLNSKMTALIPSKTSYKTNESGEFNKTFPKFSSSDIGKWEYYIKIGNTSQKVNFNVTGIATPAPTGPLTGVGSNIKTTDGTIWFLTDGNCRSAYTSSGAFLSYGFNSWLTVRDAIAADTAIPICASNNGFTLPREGKILCSDHGSDKGTCYLISGGKKNGFTSEKVFNGLGFSFSNSTMADVSWMDNGSNISDLSSAHLPGVILNNNGTIQIVTNNGIVGFPDMSVFNSWGFSLVDVVMANQLDRLKTQNIVLQTRTLGKLNP